MSYELLLGDCIQVMRTLPANSVQCCVSSPPYYGLRAYLDNGHDDKPLEIGTEETPELYVAKLVDVFREVRRLLHPTGVVWLNLGDSYASGGGISQPHRNNNGGFGGSDGKRTQDYALAGGDFGRPNTIGHGLKPKDLIGIPWMVAFALRADGWWLRSEIIWHKRAPMPESVTDRPTKAHEQVFLLTKSSTYFYDAEAIAEQAIGNDPGNLTHKHQNGAGIVLGRKTEPNGGLLNVSAASTRNKRSVWTLGPESYAGAHFATMPTKLVEPCILAGTSAKGCCAACGAPWERVVERTDEPDQSAKGSRFDAGKTATNGLGRVQSGERYLKRAAGWQPTCSCSAAVVPCTVLDPFAGSGTTLAVALKHHRHAIGIELNQDYLELARTRIERMQPLLLVAD